MPIHPSFYSVFPLGALKKRDQPTEIHLGDSSKSVVYLRVLSTSAGSEDGKHSVYLSIEVSSEEGVDPVTLNLTHRNMPLNLLMQVQSGLSDHKNLKNLPMGNLVDFLLDQLNPGEMRSRLGSYIRNRDITPTLLRPEYLDRLKVSAPCNYGALQPAFKQRQQTLTLHEKLALINQIDTCAGEKAHQQTTALIEAVLGSHVAIEYVFASPWVFAGAALSMPFAVQMNAWTLLASMINQSGTKAATGLLSSSRINYPPESVEAFLDQGISLIVVGGHQGLDALLEQCAAQRFIPLLKIPKRDQHQDRLLQLIGQQLISDKDHWTSRGAQGRMARTALQLAHIRQAVPAPQTKKPS
ncbi:MAG: hypothetical protein IBX50_04990 [Marinospirillum sp.]|uniref:hypothetical protein n=1 Tax=Marinospirillum sp. TaxID=2183934 RepID=UPI001A099972|nr:hypothetical protein [Marinospirillum sp.]MBE0506063.1 hypothetical protein [Marinospirillum sp.]